jgi:hypothetical protein
MATTIRVYIDGGSTPVASGPMNADRTFSVPVTGLANGTHTVEVTAQEDGKGESPRAIQTITVNHIAVAAALAGDLVVTLTQTADLTAPGAPTQQALAGDITISGAVTGNLTLAFMALYGGSPIALTTAADLTAPGGAGFTGDTFTGANGSAPDASKWTTSTASGSGSVIDIQSNTLRAAAKSSVAGTYQASGVTSVLVSGTTHTINVDFTQIQTDANSVCDVQILASTGTSADNSLTLRFTAGSLTLLYPLSYVNGTLYQGDPVSLPGTLPYTFQIVIAGAATPTLKVNGTSYPLTYFQDPDTIPLPVPAWGTGLKIALLQQSSSATVLKESRFDNVTVS